MWFAITYTKSLFLHFPTGIAPNCMLAKICSDKNKPNGQYRIQPTRQAVMDFIKDLPIRKVGYDSIISRVRYNISFIQIKLCVNLGAVMHFQHKMIIYTIYKVPIPLCRVL